LTPRRSEPGIGPVGLELGGPLELGRSVIEVRLVAHRAEPEREEAEAQMEKGVIPIVFGPLD
jgi:hypothetical protein